MRKSFRYFFNSFRKNKFHFIFTCICFVLIISFAYVAFAKTLEKKFNKEIYSPAFDNAFSINFDEKIKVGELATLNYLGELGFAYTQNDARFGRLSGKSASIISTTLAKHLYPNTDFSDTTCAKVFVKSSSNFRIGETFDLCIDNVGFRGKACVVGFLEILEKGVFTLTNSLPAMFRNNYDFTVCVDYAPTTVVTNAISFGGNPQEFMDQYNYATKNFPSSSATYLASLDNSGNTYLFFSIFFLLLALLGIVAQKLLSQSYLKEKVSICKTIGASRATIAFRELFNEFIIVFSYLVTSLIVIIIINIASAQNLLIAGFYFAAFAIALLVSLLSFSITIVTIWKTYRKKLSQSKTF